MRRILFVAVIFFSLALVASALAGSSCSPAQDVYGGAGSDIGCQLAYTGPVPGAPGPGLLALGGLGLLMAGMGLSLRMRAAERSERDAIARSFPHAAR